MRFLLDMGVSVHVAAWLREQGHDPLHLRDEGLQRLPNGEIFTKAISEGRVILTFDLDSVRSRRSISKMGSTGSRRRRRPTTGFCSPKAARS